MFSYKVDENLELRMFEYDQAEELFYLIEQNRDYLKTWLGWVDRSKCVEDSMTFIKFTKQSYATEQGIKVGMWYKDKLVGLIDHHEVKKNNKSLNIGYWLNKDCQGKGIMTKSAVAMINYAFEIGMNKVEIRCAKGNNKSRAIPERLGFINEGTIRAAEYLYDHYVDHVVYGMLKEEWCQEKK